MIKGIFAFILSLTTAMSFNLPDYNGSERNTQEAFTAMPALNLSDVPRITAKSVLIANLNTGQHIGEINSSAALPIASISKVFTAHTALNTLNPSTPVEFSVEAISTDGAAGDFLAGEEFELKDLISAMMMYSSNDAAMAIAEATGAYMGGNDYNQRIDMFVELMNRKALELDMRDTFFKNPTGLDNPDGEPSNFSTARDLVVLLQKTKNTPFLWDQSRDSKKTIYSLSGNPHNLLNLNQLIENIPHLVGGKTGSTDSSGESLVLLYEYPLGETYGFVLLGANEGMRFYESKLLLRHAMNILE